nr:MAG TPA: hypothetical protein [Caudoviricetes sp.]
MKYGLLLEPRDLRNIIHEYHLNKHPEEYSDETMQQIIAKYFSTNQRAVVETGHGFIVLMTEEEGE